MENLHFSGLESSDGVDDPHWQCENVLLTSPAPKVDVTGSLVDASCSVYHCLCLLIMLVRKYVHSPDHLCSSPLQGIQTDCMLLQEDEFFQRFMTAANETPMYKAYMRIAGGLPLKAGFDSATDTFGISGSCMVSTPLHCIVRASETHCTGPAPGSSLMGDLKSTLSAHRLLSCCTSPPNGGLLVLTTCALLCSFP